MVIDAVIEYYIDSPSNNEKRLHVAFYPDNTGHIYALQKKIKFPHYEIVKTDNYYTYYPEGVTGDWHINYQFPKRMKVPIEDAREIWEKFVNWGFEKTV